MGLRLKFNLALIITTLIGLGISGAVSQKLLVDNARKEVLEMARLMEEATRIFILQPIPGQ